LWDGRLDPKLVRMDKLSLSASDAPLRGRPPLHEVARRKRHLLETAMALFMESGLSISMDAIAARAGVSKRTLYARYPDKMALFVGVLEWLSSEQTDTALSLAPDMPLHQALVCYGKALFEHYSTPHIAAFLRLMQKEKERVPDLERIMRQEVLRDQIMPLVRYLEAQPDGLLRDFDRLVAARMHVRNIIGEITEAYAEGRKPDANESRGFLEKSAAILSAGLLAGPQSD
jgi:TetR/AcrR family transcriptional regulator, mexJK operon transcriptional repressor